LGHKVSDKTLEKMIHAALGRYLNGKNHPMFGQNHSEETKNKYLL
jgi:hypothetical protein